MLIKNLIRKNPNQLYPFQQNFTTKTSVLSRQFCQSEKKPFQTNLGLRGSRRQTKYKQEISQINQQTLSENFDLNNKVRVQEETPDDTTYNEEKERLNALYQEQCKDYQALLSIYEKDKQFECKSELTSILYQLRDNKLLKSELTLHILVALSDIHLSLRENDESASTYENIATIFKDDPTITARAYYNASLIRLMHTPRVTYEIIINQLYKDSFYDLPQIYKSTLEEYLGLTYCLTALQKHKSESSQPAGTKMDMSSKSISDMNKAQTCFEKTGQLQYSTPVQAGWANNLSQVLFHNINMSGQKLETIIDQELHLYQTGFFEEGNEITLEQNIEHGFIQTPIIRCLKYKLDLPLNDLENLGELIQTFQDTDLEDGFFERVQDSDVMMLANLAYFLMQSKTKSHRLIGIQFLGLSKIFVERSQAIILKSSIQAYINILYAVYFFDNGIINSGQKILDSIINNPSLDYRSDSLVIFAVQLLASGMKASGEHNYVPIFYYKTIV